MYAKIIRKSAQPRLKPSHILVPLLNGTRYFSNSFACSPNQRSGLKTWGSGKMEVSWCTNQVLVLTTVFEVISKSLKISVQGVFTPAATSFPSITAPPAGTMRGKPLGMPGPMRRDSLITAFYCSRQHALVLALSKSWIYQER